MQALALRSGRSQIALIREAIDAFLQQQQPQGRLARLRQGGGLWVEHQSQAVAFLEGTEQPLAMSVITIAEPQPAPFPDAGRGVRALRQGLNPAVACHCSRHLGRRRRRPPQRSAR